MKNSDSHSQVVHCIVVPAPETPEQLLAKAVKVKAEARRDLIARLDAAVLLAEDLHAQVAGWGAILESAQKVD